MQTRARAGRAVRSPGVRRHLRREQERFDSRRASSNARSTDASRSTADRSTGSCAAKNSTCCFAPIRRRYALYPWPAPDGARSAVDLRHRDARRLAVRRLSAHDAAPRDRKCRRRSAACASRWRSSSISSNAATTACGIDRDRRRRLVLRFLRERPRRGRAQRDRRPRSARWACASQSAHHEHGAGQHEIDLVHEDPLVAADNVLTLRTLAKHVASRFASRRDLHAQTPRRSRRQRPARRLPAWRRERRAPRSTSSAACSRTRPHPPPSAIRRSTRTNASSPHGTRRSTPSGPKRSANALVRVPPPTKRRRASKCAAPTRPAIRISRSPSSSAPPPTASPQTRSPAQPLTGSTYDLTERERRETRHRHAAEIAAPSDHRTRRRPIVRGALGDHLYHAFRDAKLAEYERYRRAVHPWERDMYLRQY